MRITLPLKANIAETTAADPLKFYYLPVALVVLHGPVQGRSAAARRPGRHAGGSRLRVRHLLAGTGQGLRLPPACDTHPNLHLAEEMPPAARG